MKSRALRGGLLAVLTVLATATVADASSSRTPRPPAWQDLASQAFQIANSAHPYVQSLDAALRDLSNGTTAGYVYSLTSDTAQIGVTVKGLITDARALARHVAQADAQAYPAIEGYNAIRDYYKDYQDRYNATQCLVTGSTPGSTAPDPACEHDQAMIIYCWEGPTGSTAPSAQPTPADTSRAGFPKGPGDTVNTTSVNAHFDYGEAINDLDAVSRAGAELLLQVRDTVGDAHDYASNKEVGLLIQALNEDRVAKALGGIATKLTALKPHLRAEYKQMNDAWNTDDLLAGLAGVGYPPSTPVPPVLSHL